MGVDESVRRGLREVPPADPTGAYDRVVEKKVHRRIVRRAQSVALATVVVAGSAVGFAALVHAFRPDATPAGRSMGGVSISPSETKQQRHQTAAPGQDIGLGYDLCDVQTLRHVDFFGDGADGTAWTGAPLTESGRCPFERSNTYVVAVDLSGDGLADDAWHAIENCYVCEPYAAVDLDGNGDDELAVLTSGGTTPRYDFFDVRQTDAGEEIRPVLIEPPGDEPAGFGVGEIAGWTPGGDEGYSGNVACEGFPEHPVLLAGWSWAPVDGPGSETEEVHLVRFVIEEGRARILSAEDFTQPSGEPLPDAFRSDYRACGVHWYPLG